MRDLSLTPPRQVEIPHEDIARIEIAAVNIAAGCSTP
jgi:hypothetical protein